ncbi:hypothetical protein CLAIMM_13959 [Cladophialophora immunda]|nr:hypothetical protein CLAIMM_13959 [Cladophialophora immunda]
MPSDDTTDAGGTRDVQKNGFVFPEDGKKPLVETYKQKYKFSPGDEVYIRQSGHRAREGPYLVEKAESGKYTLCNSEGVTVKNGQKFEDKELELHDPFE